MENSGVDWEKAKNIPIPEYDWEKGSPEEFYQTFVRRPHPVILRNFIKGSEIMDYTFDNLVEKFGDTPVVLTGQKSGCIGKLKEVQDPDNYVQNSESLFNRHPGKKIQYAYALCTYNSHNSVDILKTFQNYGSFFKRKNSRITSKRRHPTHSSFLAAKEPELLFTLLQSGISFTWLMG